MPTIAVVGRWSRQRQLWPMKEHSSLTLEWRLRMRTRRLNVRPTTHVNDGLWPGAASCNWHPGGLSLQCRHEEHLGRRCQSLVQIGKRPRAFGQWSLFEPLKRTECALV